MHCSIHSGCCYITILHTDLNRGPNEGLIRAPDRHALFPYPVESNKNTRIKSIAL